MIHFLLKGLLRDKSRSLFPLLVVIAGVILTVFLHSWINGAMNSMVNSTARFNSGHVKIMSRAYAKEADQIPNDLAFIGAESLISDLKERFPDLDWTPRIRFGGLLDIPDKQGETRAQGPVTGLAVDLFSAHTPEYHVLNLKEAVVRGRLPRKPGEIVVSDDFALRLGINLGETATLISSTMYGGMAITNFKIVGTIRFGIMAMDRGAMVADVSDIQQALDMQDAAGEVLGYFKNFLYDKKRAEEITFVFNTQYEKNNDEFAPKMEALTDQSSLAELLQWYSYFSGIIITIFVVVMSIVLWNAGLMGSLRRYGEIGVRLAMGETKSHIYYSMMVESVILGMAGSVAGTSLGLAVAYYFQVHGINIASLLRNATILFSDVMRAEITPVTFVIGFIPGLLATFLGTAISGIGIYRRQTSQLTKELET